MSDWYEKLNSHSTNNHEHYTYKYEHHTCAYMYHIYGLVKSYILYINAGTSYYIIMYLIANVTCSICKGSYACIKFLT